MRLRYLNLLMYFTVFISRPAAFTLFTHVLFQGWRTRRWSFKTSIERYLWLFFRDDVTQWGIMLNICIMTSLSQVD